VQIDSMAADEKRRDIYFRLVCNKVLRENIPAKADQTTASGLVS